MHNEGEGRDGCVRGNPANLLRFRGMHYNLGVVSVTSDKDGNRRTGASLPPACLPRTGALFAVPGFFRGAARILDLAALFNRYNTSSTTEEADSWAIYRDWLAVGDDIRAVFDSAATARKP